MCSEALQRVDIKVEVQIREVMVWSSTTQREGEIVEWEGGKRHRDNCQAVHPHPMKACTWMDTL